MPYFKHPQKNPDGVLLPPRLSMDGQEQVVCMKGSSKDKVCPKRKCHFLHLVTLEMITKGMPAL